MELKHRGKALAAGILAGALLGGGLAALTPAGAAVSSLADDVNWKQAWQDKIKPRTDNRYYTKDKSNDRYYTKSKSDKNLATGLAGYYTKADSDAKYAPLPGVIRGISMQAVTAAGAGNVAGADISFGFTLSAAPTPHYIPIGAPPPLGCTGTAASPNAQPGHLCVFEVVASNTAANFLVGPTGSAAVTATGAVLFGISAAAGQMVITTSWAVRPIALAPPSAKIKGTLTPNKGGPFLR